MTGSERLPIKFFAKRDADNLRVEPGFSENPPKWLLSGDELVSRSKSLVSAFEVVRTEAARRERENSLIPLVFKAEIIEDALAKSHRKEISSLFGPGGRDSILGLADANEVMVKVETAAEADAIAKNLRNIDGYARALSAVKGIEAFDPAIVESAEPDDYKVKLIDFQNFEQNRAIRDYFERKMRELGFEVKRTHYSREHVIFNVKSVDVDSLRRIRETDAIESVFSIEPMPRYRVGLDMMPDDVEVDVLRPDENQDYGVVGVLDNGVADIPHLKPWIIDTWSPYPEELMAKDHGTFVSGVVVYGDRLEGHTWVGTDGLRILDACVFPDPNKETLQEDELIANIQEAIRAHGDRVKVWSLSISVQKTVDDYSFSDFAVALDDLQDEFNVLICKSAGNCLNFVTGRPKGRLHHGADSVRSIVVGSIAHKKSSGDLADVDNPSPFSRIGRGPSFIIKPEVVHYGGNAGVDALGRVSQTGVKSFGVDGSICQSVGTSFSTPRIAALAAGLHHEMEEEFDPLLLKALIIHSATYSDKLALPLAERVNQVGFGRPSDVGSILYNSPHEVTLIMRDEMAKGEKIDVMEFPMPECLIDGDYYFGQIAVTLVYNPILEPSQRAEYCQSNIEVKMGTFDETTARDTTRRSILNPVGRDGSQNVLLERLYSKRRIKESRSDFALKERLLIQYADKYYPVKKYAVDLSELTEGNRQNHLTKDKKWYLFLQGLYREHIENRAQAERFNPSQEFCLLITVKDPSNTRPVYDMVTQKLDEYNFWHSSIRTRSEVRIEQ